MTPNDNYGRLSTGEKKQLGTYRNLFRNLPPDERDAAAQAVFDANRQQREPVTAASTPPQPGATR